MLPNSLKLSSASLAHGGLVLTAALASLTMTGCNNGNGHGRFLGGGGGAGASGIITAAGGDVQVNKKGLLQGARVQAPVNAVDPNESVLVKIRSQATLPGALDPAFTALGTTVNITKDTPYNFLLPLTVTLPYDPNALGAGDEPTAFYWDTTYNKYLPVALRSVDTTNHLITFSTVHCTSFITATMNGLGGTQNSVDTGFMPNVDGFFMPNFGSYDNPGGSSSGMAAFASWYFLFKKPTDTNGLFNKYRQGDPNLFQDDVITRELINRCFIAGSQIWANIWNGGLCNLTPAQSGLALIAGMKLTGMPQILMLKGTGSGGKDFATCVLVYRYDAGSNTFAVYDPNFPGEEAAVTWTLANGFSNYTKAPAYPGPISDFCFEGISTFIDPKQFEGYYANAEAAWADLKTYHINVTNPTIDANNIALITDLVNDVAVDGTVTGGNVPAKFLCWYINGGQKHITPLGAGGSFNLLLTQAMLPNPSNSMIMIATDNPRDEWRAYNGFKAFTLKKQGVNFFCNLGFETGDFNCWAIESHFWNGAPNTIVPAECAVVGATVDPEAAAITTPYTGTFAARINDWSDGCHISTCTQSAVVPNVPNPQLQFYWSAVLEDPSHPPSAQPYVDILVTDDTMGTVLYQKHFFTNDPSYSGWLPFQGGSWKAIAWQVAFIDVFAAQGHTVTISITGADCGFCGHGGVVYVDGDE
jgi:hypothetical protein